jgi:hypothetical protein
VATETDAARDRVLAARAALGGELEALEASARAAVDIPAKVRRSPAKAAALAGSAGFLVLGGPKRLFGAARRAIFGPTAELPKRMLPDEIEKTLSKLGDDGDKIRGAIERDFAAYAREAAKDRGIAPLLSASVAKPLLARGARAAAEWLFRTDDEGFQARLTEVRDRAKDEVAKRRDGSDGTGRPAARPGDDDSGSAGA